MIHIALPQLVKTHKKIVIFVLTFSFLLVVSGTAVAYHYIGNDGKEGALKGFQKIAEQVTGIPNQSKNTHSSGQKNDAKTEDKSTDGGQQSKSNTGASGGTSSNKNQTGSNSGAGASGGAGQSGSPGGTTPPPTPTRDPLKQPFASSSIWNMPIGSSAQYVNAQLPAITASYSSDGVWTPIHYPDPDRIVMQPAAPLTPIYFNDVGWNGGDRCAVLGGVIHTVPIPANYVVPNSMHNNGAAFLMPDKRTIIQTQPFTRCLAGGPATSWTTYHPAVDIYGPGIEGAHGGSGLSAIGGTLRIGELRPGGTVGPRHALKINLITEKELFKCQTTPACYRWPANKADTGAVGSYGTQTNNNISAMKMGALLAIPASTNINAIGLETTPAKLLAWTLQNYGAYIVDHGGPSLSVEDGPAGSFSQQFQSDWGFDMEARVRDNSPWSRDFNRLRQALYVVNNNTVSSIGGGGSPLQPLAPEIHP
jgi:hypothetical protein